jgi:hypothetical protein
MPIEVSLEELACRADHVLVGRVVGVELVNRKGRVLKNGMTGPSLDNTIRLVIAVDEVLESNAAEVPESLKVPLDPFMHYSVEQVRRAHAGDTRAYLVLLAGAKFQPVVPGHGLRGISERETVMSLRASCKKPKS